MTFRKTRRGVLPAVQLTSMMDIIFLLLFFITPRSFRNGSTRSICACPRPRAVRCRTVCPVRSTPPSPKTDGFRQPAGPDSTRLDALTVWHVASRGSRSYTRRQGDACEDVIKVIDTCRKADI